MLIQRRSPSSRPPSSASARAAMVVVVERLVAGGGDHGDGREDAADEVGPAGGGVLVGGGEQRPQREVDGLVAVHALAPRGLDPVAGVDAAGAVGLEVGFLVLAAGDVVAEHPAACCGGRRSRRTAARPRSPAMAAGRLARTICASWLALPSRLQELALDLLVVLELHLEQAHHLDRRARRRRRWRRPRSRRPGTPSPCAGWRSGCRRWHGGRPPSPRRRRSGSRARWCRARSRAARAGSPLRAARRGGRAARPGAGGRRTTTRDRGRARRWEAAARSSRASLFGRCAQPLRPHQRQFAQLVAPSDRARRGTRPRSAARRLESRNCPRPPLQLKQRMPRTSPVSCEWSTCSGSARPQIAHTPPCSLDQSVEVVGADAVAAASGGSADCRREAFA